MYMCVCMYVCICMYVYTYTYICILLLFKLVLCTLCIAKGKNHYVILKGVQLHQILLFLLAS